MVGPTMSADTHNSVDRADFGNVDFGDPKNAFIFARCKDKDVLDIGSVMHDPENYQSRFWTFKGIALVAKTALGLDYVAEGVRFLNERGFKMVCADAQEFELDQTFDVIVAGDLIEHLENMQGFIECCKKHLRPGGKLVISTPNPWYWRAVVKAAFTSEQATNYEHVCWFCPRTLRQLLARHGMVITEVRHVSRYWRDRLMPLPPALKHTNFLVEAIAAPV